MSIVDLAVMAAASREIRVQLPSLPQNPLLLKLPIVMMMERVGAVIMMVKPPAILRSDFLKIYLHTVFVINNVLRDSTLGLTDFYWYLN